MANILKTSDGKILRLSDGRVLKDNPFTLVKFGLLYNWYATSHENNISASGWSIPSRDNWITLTNVIGTAIADVGDYMKVSADNASNLYANDAYGFGGVAGGYRIGVSDGAFNYKNSWFLVMSTALVTSYDPDKIYLFGIRAGYAVSTAFLLTSTNIISGHSVRLIKDSTDLSDGEKGTYTGNDGKVYPTICIGTQEWLADNLCETKFRNGDIIPWYGADAANYFTGSEWVALTTAGCCAYSNTLSNVAEGFTFPT